MYAIYGNIYHQYIPNVSIYTIHGSYGIVIYMFRASCACSPRRFQISQLTRHVHSRSSLSFLGTFMGPQNNSRFDGSEPILLHITTYFYILQLQITTYCYILVLLHIATFV